MKNYILTTDLSAYEAALKELTLWNRLKKYVCNSCRTIAVSIIRNNTWAAYSIK